VNRILRGIDLNNAAKNTSRETHAQSIRGKGNERTLCSIDGYSIEMNN
jgi:hypothetical protein